VSSGISRAGSENADADKCNDDPTEVAVPRQMFADILSLIARLRAPPAI
jgi:hypothetical protein